MQKKKKLILILSQISQAPPPISHSDHCQLSFNSNHLHLINTQLSQHYLTHLTSVSCQILLTRSGLSPSLHSYSPSLHSYSPSLHSYSPTLHSYSPTLHSYSPQDCVLPVPRLSSVSPMSACLRPSPQLIFSVGPRCVLNHIIHKFPGKKTIISISFNILSTSRYFLTILPDC